MKRIAIIGSGGAGKSTLSRQLGEILDVWDYPNLNRHTILNKLEKLTNSKEIIHLKSMNDASKFFPDYAMQTIKIEE